MPELEPGVYYRGGTAAFEAEAMVSGIDDMEVGAKQAVAVMAQRVRTVQMTQEENEAIQEAEDDIGQHRCYNQSQWHGTADCGRDQMAQGDAAEDEEDDDAKRKLQFTTPPDTPQRNKQNCGNASDDVDCAVGVSPWHENAPATPPTQPTPHNDERDAKSTGTPGDGGTGDIVQEVPAREGDGSRVEDGYPEQTVQTKCEKEAGRRPAPRKLINLGTAYGSKENVCEAGQRFLQKTMGISSSSAPRH